MQLDYKGKVSQGPAKLEDYYTHLIRLFSETNAHEQVIAVAKLALAELSNVSRVLHLCPLDWTVRTKLFVPGKGQSLIYFCICTSLNRETGLLQPTSRSVTS